MSMILLKCCSVRSFRESNNILKIWGKNVSTRWRAHTRSLSDISNVEQQQDQWQAIYRFPLIGLVAAYNRLKKPYGLFNAVALPCVYTLEQMSYLPPTFSNLAAAIGVTTWLTLMFSSLLSTNLVGFIYINKSSDKLKLAYVDYWGQRHDKIVSLDDLLLECESQPTKSRRFYHVIRLHSDHGVKYKVLHKYGTIEDHYTFTELFGDI